MGGRNGRCKQQRQRSVAVGDKSGVGSNVCRHPMCGVHVSRDIRMLPAATTREEVQPEARSSNADRDKPSAVKPRQQSTARNAIRTSSFIASKAAGAVRPAAGLLQKRGFQKVRKACRCNQVNLENQQQASGSCDLVLICVGGIILAVQRSRSHRRIRILNGLYPRVPVRRCARAPEIRSNQTN